MAVKAIATITLHAVVDVSATYRYYKLQSATLAAPGKPTAKPADPLKQAPSGWSVAEPAYSTGSTDKLYTVDLTVFSDDTFQYSNVSLSSSYEAAKEAWNKANNAQSTADSAKEDIDNLEIGGRNLLKNSEHIYLRSSDFRNNVELEDGKITILTKGLFNAHAYVGAKMSESPALIGENTGGEYTFSGEIKTTGLTNTAYLEFDIRTRAGAQLAVSAGIIPPNNNGKWLKVYGSVTIPELPEAAFESLVCITSRYASTSWADARCVIEYRKFKLEKGNKATDWTPAPEDAISTVDVEYYLSTSATTLSGGSWSTTAPAWVDGKYMWSRTVTTDGAGNKTYSPSQNGVCIAGAKGSTGDKGDKGDTGSAGKGVASIAEQYYRSTSATSLSEGSWSDTCPGWENGKYIWTRSVITYTDSTTTTTTAVCVTGEKGSTGDKGDTGPRGIDVKSVTRYYYLSATAPTTPSTSWTTTEPAYDATADADKSLYYADYTVYSSGSPTWSAISKSSSYEAAKQAYNEAAAAAQKLASWCAENNQTLIDGSKIYTGSVGAKQINVTDLFAQDITASGTIRGVNLVGAKGSFNESLSVYSSTEESDYRMGLKADASAFKVGWWNKVDEEDPTTSFIEIEKSGQVSVISNIRDIDLHAKSNINLTAANGSAVISGSGCSIEAVMRHGLEFENNKRIGFQTSTGASSRGIGFSTSDNLLFGSGDSGLTNGVYFYVGAQDTFAVYGGTAKDVRFRSFKSGDSMYFQVPDVYNRTTSSGSNVRVNSNGTLYRYSSSSMRYKTDITTKLSDELDPERLYDLKVWQYKYREGHLDKDDQRCGQDIIGFIAEDVKQKYPIAVNYNEDGQTENWNVEMIVPAMLKLIQDQKKEITSLEERVSMLEDKINSLTKNDQ